MGLDASAYTSPIEPTQKCNFRDSPHLNEDYGHFSWDRVPDCAKKDYYDASQDKEISWFDRHWNLHKWMQRLFDINNGNNSTLKHDALEFSHSEDNDCIICYMPMDLCVCTTPDWERFKTEVALSYGDGEYTEFCGKSVELSRSDIIRLEQDMINLNLPNYKEEKDWEMMWHNDEGQDLLFIEKALKAIDAGLYVYYIGDY